jgi:SAM-dependent methyltransferase
MIDALSQYDPALPLPLLVAELNKLYHEHEAASYERTHPEIFHQLPALWQQMIEVARPRLPDAPHGLRILDFGCGTGFEARQCLDGFGASRIARLVCYDPSLPMIQHCRQSLEALGVQAEYISEVNQLNGEFDLLITNSVLHHLVEPGTALSSLMALMAPHALWLSGHEPSRRYLGNAECRATLKRYNDRQRWQKLLQPPRYVRRALRWAGWTELPADYAARCAFERSLFKRRPPARLVSSLVDFHVMVDESDCTEPRGLDFREMEAIWGDRWELLWRHTYSFLGPNYEGGLSPRWQSVAQRLAVKHPDDGGNCCLVWGRRAWK